MKLDPWQWLKTFPGLFAAPRPEPLRQAERIVSVQRRIVMPVRIGVLAALLYFIFSADWLSDIPGNQAVIVQTLRSFLGVYIFCNVVSGVIFFSWRRFPPGLFQWLVFVLGLLDGLFVAGFMLLTNGSESNAFWLFPILIVLNAISIPLAMPQIVLNLTLSVFYIGVGIVSADLGQGDMPPAYVPGLSPQHAPK